MLKALEFILETVEADTAAVGEDQSQIMVKLWKFKIDKNKFLKQMMKPMNEHFAEMHMQSPQQDTDTFSVH